MIQFPQYIICIFSNVFIAFIFCFVMCVCLFWRCRVVLRIEGAHRRCAPAPSPMLIQKCLSYIYIYYACLCRGRLEKNAEPIKRNASFFNFVIVHCCGGCVIAMVHTLVVQKIWRRNIFHLSHLCAVL